MFVIGGMTDARLARVLAAMEGEAPTYPDVGATADPDHLPDGYHHDRAAGELGAGDGAFAAATGGLRSWVLHRGQGFRVVPASPPLAPGTDVVVAVPFAPAVHVIAACRIVWVVDEPDRVGFAYGTLPAHPASGEEAFVVSRDAGGTVRVDVYAFSQPRHPLARLGAPVARRQQARALRGYVDALARHVETQG